MAEEATVEATEEGAVQASETQETETQQPESVADTATETTQAEDWRAGIEDAKLAKFAERFTTPHEALKTAFELRQKVSNAVTLPGKNATEEDLKDFYTKLGVPESVDGYGYSSLGIPEGLDAESVSEELAELATALHKSGATPAVAKAAAEARIARMVAEQDATSAAIEETRAAQEAALKNDWGKDYEPNIQYAVRAAKQFGGGDFESLLDETINGVRLGDHPMFLKTFATIGRKMGEGGLHTIMDTADKESTEQQLNDLTQEAYVAQARGDKAKADQLYKKRDELSKKYYGSE